MTKEEELLKLFELEMNGAQLNLMATLAKAERLIDQTVNGDKEEMKKAVKKILTQKLTAILEICDVKKR